MLPENIKSVFVKTENQTILNYRVITKLSGALHPIQQPGLYWDSPQPCHLLASNPGRGNSCRIRCQTC